MPAAAAIALALALAAPASALASADGGTAVQKSGAAVLGMVRLGDGLDVGLAIGASRHLVPHAPSEPVEALSAIGGQERAPVVAIQVLDQRHVPLSDDGREHRHALRRVRRWREARGW